MPFQSEQDESKNKSKFASLGFLGKRHSEDAKRKMSETKKRLFAEGKLTNWNKGLPREMQPRYGRKHSEETKQTMSLIQKKYFQTHHNWSFGLTKETDERVRKISLSSKGKQKSEEWKKKIKNANKNYYKDHKQWSYGLTKEINEGIRKQSEKISGKNNPFYGKTFPGKKCVECGKGLGKNHSCINPMLGRRHSDHAREIMRQARLHRVFPRQDTSIEIKIQNGLSKLDIAYEKHKVIEKFVQSDLFIEPNIVIFADGCYFHGCPIHYPDRTKLDGIQNKNVIRDILINQFFNNLNGKYIILRFWEHEIKNNIDGCINKITESVRDSIQTRA